MQLKGALLFLSLLPLGFAAPSASSAGNGVAKAGETGGASKASGGEKAGAGEAAKGASGATKSSASSAKTSPTGKASADANTGGKTGGNTKGNAGASNATAAAASNNTPSDTQIANAVSSWMNDTGKVTNFLNTAASFSGDEFTRQATIALNAEKDELNHKQVLDDALGQQPDVQSANNVLATQGTFQAVVDALQKMVNNGPDTAQADVDAINANRCVNVLPNIDKYFAAAGSASVKAVRPTGCLEISNAPPAATGANAGAAAAAQAGNNAGNGTEAAGAAAGEAKPGAAKTTSTATKAAAANAKETGSKAGAAAKATPTTK